ncbi:DNA polymerase I [Clostridium magnum]|uniref:DNA polymerase I n=1 Tax=Clostridium magnum DSM 2767 TaxID=1121326 RepID=A0A162UEP0_9CLOT|nr:DNA polymerase I [Clostridium magnum]KZL93821.1 DNA polymerase I [Clostridium magnum DSM 2767]SHI08288.1 DNA polymerase I [Clostridium magnum DSM 2767]
MSKEKLLILDGNSLMNRAYYALPPLTNAEGLHTNGIYGFTTMLLKMKEEIKPDYIVSTFDRSAPTFRHNEYKDYKAGRKKMPPELAEQFPVVKELLELLSINIFEIDGFEADDLIGTLSNFAENKDIEIYIVTGDRDALQLASENINVIITKKGMTEKEVYDKNRMIEEYGVTPTQFIDVKGLMGDSSDNIPGVPGVGEKTAFKLIKEYGSIENVLQNIDNISGKKIKENLLQHSEQAIFSKKLATIKTDVPIEIDLDSIKSKDNYDAEGVRRLFIKLQFKSLIDKMLGGENLNQNLENHTEEIEVKYLKIDDIEKFRQLTENIVLICKKDNKLLYLTFKTVEENIYSRGYIEKIFINLDLNNYVIELKQLYEENKDKVAELLKNIFEDEGIKKVSHDVKIPHTILHKMGVDFLGVKFDTKIAAYLIDSSKGEYDLKTILQDYLQVNVPGDSEECQVKKTDLLNKVFEVLELKIKEGNMEELLYKVEQPLTDVLASMEYEGFRVDKDKLTELGKKFKLEIDNVQKEIFELSEEEFNINSPKQLGKILFEKLDLPVIKKTKTGYSTNAEVLEELSDKHPIIEKITYYRQLTKLYSTYIEGLKAVIDEDGKIHSSFNQAVTATGRLSSTEPNLQNIPIKYEMGKEIRKVFVPDTTDQVILSADYSQIELRVLAHIGNDENLIDAFIHHSDIHTKTASEVFKVPIEEVTSTQRSNAKAVNFGIVYGIGDFSLAKDLKISRKEAKNYIDAYFDRYPGVKKYMDDIINEAKETLYVTTVMNRRRFIPEIKASNKMVRSFGERLAMNTPIQGSAADIIKLAMVNVYNEIKQKRFKSKLILQVHDELILNVYKDELEEVKAMVKREMENVLKLRVPLEVDVSVGENWYEAK